MHKVRVHLGGNKLMRIAFQSKPTPQFFECLSSWLVELDISKAMPWMTRLGTESLCSIYSQSLHLFICRSTLLTTAPPLTPPAIPPIKPSSSPPLRHLPNH